MKNDFLSFLKKRLQRGALPGRTSQLKMVPKPLDEQEAMREMNAPESARRSSVLVLLFPDREQKPELVLTVRSNDIRHGGQISFPGGLQEKGESAAETALREAQEEIGIQPDEVSTAGMLSTLYISPSNSLVEPVVGFLPRQPDFKQNYDEVEEIFTVPVEDLLDKQNLTEQNWQLKPGALYKVPFWEVHATPLWGATAMILSEFLELYKEYKLNN